VGISPVASAAWFPVLFSDKATAALATGGEAGITAYQVNARLPERWAGLTELGHR